MIQMIESEIQSFIKLSIYFCLFVSDYLSNKSLLGMIDQQQKLLEDAKKAAKEQAYFMRRALDNADLRSGLKHTSLMLTELKTSLLSPRNYYILFMAIFDYMRELENYFKDDTRRGRKMVDVYQAVQHAPEIIPRIYLLITAGSVYIQSHEVGSEKILDDIISMMKAVQNPLRGLFLRYYFLKMCKDRLPDTGSEYENQNRGVKQAIETIHINLKESTNLWMRIGGGRDKAKRLKEKNDLKMLIGQNLMRISSLQGLNIKIYKQIVLPKMLELIQWTKDAMSQQYLLDCMIQGFPQEFHINTLPELLNTCSKECEKEVDMKSIFIALMNRLSTYLSDSGNVIENIENGFSVYELFSVNIKQLVKKSEPSQVKNTLNLYAAFLQFTLKCYPNKHEYVNQILGDASNFCANFETSIDDDCQLYISKFLTTPLQTMANIILTMDQYPRLNKYLKFKRKREVAKHITKAIVKGNIDLTSEKMVTQVLSFIQPLLVKLPDYEQVTDLVFKQEQIQVAKIVFLINSQEVSVVWGILKKFIDRFIEGGEERIKYTLPSTIFRLFQLGIQIFNNRDQSTEPKVYKRIFDLCRNLIGRLSAFPQIAIKLYLELLMLINVIDQNKFYDEYTYETAVECLTLYEEQVTDAKQKKQVLELIINSCMKLNCVSEQNYDTLVTNIISFCSKIMKKNEQCQILLSCCFLFTNPLAQANRIHEVLKRCAKLANSCISQSMAHLSLFLDILDSYLFFVRQKNIIEDKDDAISQLTSAVEQKIKEPADTEEVKAHISACLSRWQNLSKKCKEG